MQIEALCLFLKVNWKLELKFGFGIVLPFVEFDDIFWLLRLGLGLQSEGRVVEGQDVIKLLRRSFRKEVYRRHSTRHFECLIVWDCSRAELF